RSPGAVCSRTHKKTRARATNATRLAGWLAPLTHRSLFRSSSGRRRKRPGTLQSIACPGGLSHFGGGGRACGGSRVKRQRCSSKDRTVSFLPTERTTEAEGGGS
ncbi:unnamed protein product, partial [Scytosiphon promiscuus]